MPDLSLNSQKKLLEIARHCIQSKIETGTTPSFKTDSPELNLLRGCFVTLRKGSKLRGCIGTFDAQRPLYQNVMRMAVAAAFEDPRFAPVAKQELDQISIDLSVLGPLEKIHSLSEIEIGKHGILIRRGPRTGTFLPEVAVEQKWNVQEFVAYCAQEKAGLSPKELAHAEIFRYEVEKFKEM